MNHRILFLGLVLVCLLGTGQARPSQDGPPPGSQPVKPQPKLPGKLQQRFEDPFAGLIPGQLPKGTTPEAAALFEALGHSNLAPGTERTPLVAFDLAFEIITRGPGVERNQAEVRVRFEEPGFVRFAVGKDKELGFGPRGYWQRFQDGAKFLNSRDYAPDRRRINEVKSVAKNFLVLADPARLRLVSARVRPGAPGHAPAAVKARLAGLRWLELESPDFDLALGTGEGDFSGVQHARLFRATLGLDPKTGRVLEALVQELDKRAPLVATSTWVSFSDPMAIDDTLLPGTVEVRYPDLTAQPWSFQDEVHEALYLLEGRLNPALPEDAFEPPRL